MTRIKLEIGAEAVVGGVRHTRMTKATRTLTVDPFALTLLGCRHSHQVPNADHVPEGAVDLSLSEIPPALIDHMPKMAKLELQPGEESFFVRISGGVSSRR